MTSPMRYLLVYVSNVNGLKSAAYSDTATGRNDLREALANLAGGPVYWSAIYREDTEAVLERLVLTAGADQAATKGKQGAS